MGITYTSGTSLDTCYHVSWPSTVPHASQLLEPSTAVYHSFFQHIAASETTREAATIATDGRGAVATYKHICGNIRAP
jgi:hypothetical protein